MSESVVQQEWTVENAIPQHIKDELPRLATKKTQHLFIFLHIVKQLKLTKRTGWLQFGIQDAESISDHMYRMGILGFFADPKLDSGKCVKMALVHDIAESVVGDITPDDPVSKEEKHRREYTTIVYLRDLIKPFNETAANEIYDLWMEYENISTPEARYVKDVDKFELLVQCLEEEKRHNREKDLSIFLSVRKSIKTPQVQEWADDIIEERNKYWNEDSQ